MKKVLLAAGCGLGVIAGALLIWYVVFPVIGFCMEGILGFLPGLFA